MLSAMLFAVSLASTTTALPPPDPGHGDVRIAQAAGGEKAGGGNGGGEAKKPSGGTSSQKIGSPGFMDRYFPFSVNTGAAKPVQDSLVLFHLLSILPLGGLWAGLVLYPSDGRPELGQDIILSWLIPFAITIGVVLGANVPIWVLSFVFPPFACLGCLLCPVGLAGWYLSNNAAMNAWDRAYKGRPLARLDEIGPPSNRFAMAY